MADPIPSHFSTEFTSNWIARIAQTESKLIKFVSGRIEEFDGERKRFDRIDKSTARRRTERKGATPTANLSTDSRWAYRFSDEVPAILLDRDDEKNLGALVLPTSRIVQNNAECYNLSFDKLVVDTALGAVMTGEAGTTSTPFPSSQQIAHGSTGLTLAKLRAAKLKLRNADVPDGGAILVVDPEQIDDLLAVTEVASNDYNALKALVDGKVEYFMGFQIVWFNNLPITSTTRSCVVFHPDALQFTKGMMETTIDRRADLSNATQIYSYWRYGGTRLHDESVVEIQCTE